MANVIAWLTVIFLLIVLWMPIWDAFKALVKFVMGSQRRE